MKKNVSVAIISMLLILLSTIVSANEQNYTTETKKHMIPDEAKAIDTSQPDHVIGNGTPESCTEEAFIEAVAKGGKIVFNGGDKPFTIYLTKPAKVFNDANPDVVIDGGGLVTLDGGNQTRILYMNTCDKNQVYTTTHCQNQSTPRLTVQNLVFANGNSTNEETYKGGGAIFVRGGRFKVVNCRFINNRCDSVGPDVGGGAIRVFSQYNNEPVYIVNSTFGGEEGYGNIGSNGGAISSIGVSWTIINSEFSYNEAIGNGGNPAQSGTPGGGSGGAIYNDGNTMTLKLLGCKIINNKVNAYGSGIFFVTNDHSGDIVMDNTYIYDNIGGSWYPLYDGISMHSDTKVFRTFTELEGKKSPSITKIVIGQESENVTAYNFFGYNYYKLRDIAMLLKDTEVNFDIAWDEKLRQIRLMKNTSYSEIGDELTLIHNNEEISYELNKQTIIMNDKLKVFETYNIEGYNYFKLRDIATLIDFSVEWDNQSQSIIIDPYAPYEE